MTVSDLGTLAVVLTLLLHCVLCLFRRQPVREMLAAALPAAVGCLIADCAGRSGHPVLAAMMGAATLTHILHVVWRTQAPRSMPAEGQE